MNFKEYIEQYRSGIYSMICNYVQMKEPMGHYKITRDYIDRQGSYRRPGLVMLTGQLFGAKPEELMLPAAAQQLSEDWILMQDDLEDDSELRRGKPTLHRLYGVAHTIDASDTGHMAMWKMLKDYMQKVDINKGSRVFDKFYDMLVYTVEGQYIENTFIHDVKDISKADENFYFRIADSKTCYYTVYGPMQIGALAAGADPKVQSALKEIGQPAGVAFQITDDILDLIADEKVFGKRNFGDLYEGKITLMVLHAYKNANSTERAMLDSIYKKRRQEKSREEIDFVYEMIKKYDGIGYAKGIADKYGEQAKANVEKYSDLLPDNEYKDIILSAMQELYVRKK